MLETEVEMAASVCVCSFEDTGIVVHCNLTQ